MMANQHGPSPFRARGANSPAAAGMSCRPGHAANVSRAAAPVKPGTRGGSKPGAAPFPERGIRAKGWRPPMDQRIDPRIVETPTEARQGSKYGIVRYVLAISTVLVVIAFAVAYM